MAKFKYVAPVIIAASLLAAAPAQAQTSGNTNCRFSGGLGPNAACATGPVDDDYYDVVWPGRWGWGFHGDDALPGISAGLG
ncbi:hypothetical protein M2432_002415 [Mycobacterium sp. OTB74]|nr:hypothetical protein [Mycobacterium sp. OTB74]